MDSPPQRGGLTGLGTNNESTLANNRARTVQIVMSIQQENHITPRQRQKERESKIEVME